MGYVDAGYSICLTALFCYGVSLYLRHRRALRSVAVSAPQPPGEAGPIPGIGVGLLAGGHGGGDQGDPAGMTPADETPADETPAGQTPAGQPGGGL